MKVRQRNSIWLVLFLFLIHGAASEAEDKAEITKAKLTHELGELRGRLDEQLSQPISRVHTFADLLVFAKATDWILRHDEFFKPDYLQQTASALKIGQQRVVEWSEKRPSWLSQSGASVVGYVSRVDNSVQPYAISLPFDFSSKATKKWPLHVVLHGRAGTMNEVNFIHRHEGKTPKELGSWIQIDVFGRTNNAYRWAGETDVLEAIDDVCQRFSIDLNRICLRGFSMGGAGAWHLGMHYPDRWSSVGPGAGFVDFYKYQNRSEQLPHHQHLTLGIYDSIDYALNAFNVPVCTYGGELDKQLAAGASMTESAKQLGIEIDLIVGPGMGHKFDDNSRRKFLAFHAEKLDAGRPGTPRNSIKFTTRTLKYNQCDWITILGLERNYHESTITGERNESEITLTSRNIQAIEISSVAGRSINIDGQQIANSQDTVQLHKTGKNWSMDYRKTDSRLRKTKNLQGPIDDAFMEPFICVRGTGDPWNATHQTWCDWTLTRFEREFDKWLRGKVRVINDTDVNEQHIESANLILFGDPGSNSVLRRAVNQLPIRWTHDHVTVDNRQFSNDEHGLSMIYPNPLNPQRYIVINSGHTFHEKDFKASNSWLFPRLGDIAIQKFSIDPNKGFKEETVWADIFDSNWNFQIRNR